MPSDENKPYYGETAYRDFLERGVICRFCYETPKMTYYATLFGRIISVSKITMKRRFLKAMRNSDGCLQVRIDGANVSVASLMARTFIVPDCGDPYLKIYHVDDNMANDCVKNLVVYMSL